MREWRRKWTEVRRSDWAKTEAQSASFMVSIRWHRNSPAHLKRSTWISIHFFIAFGADEWWYHCLTRARSSKLLTNEVSWRHAEDSSRARNEFLYIRMNYLLETHADSGFVERNRNNPPGAIVNQSTGHFWGCPSTCILFSSTIVWHKMLTDDEQNTKQFSKRMQNYSKSVCSSWQHRQSAVNGDENEFVCFSWPK